MVILRIVLNTAALWWFFGGCWLLLTIGPKMSGSDALGMLTLTWMVGIVPACVLSAQSSMKPMDDLRAAWYAFKGYMLVMGIIFGVGAILTLMFAFSLI